MLASARSGDEEAFAQLWRDAHPALLRYLRVIAPHGSAEDVLSDVWLEVVRRLHRFRGDEAAWRGWLFTTARRRAVDDQRRLSRRPAVSIEMTGEHDWPTSPDAAHVVLENMDTAGAITLVSTLPAMQAEVIMLRVVAGLDTEQVARILGRSPGAVRVAAHRGLRRLQTMFQAAGVTT